MVIRFYNTYELKSISEYETDEIICIGMDADEDEKEMIRSGATPMLNFETKDKRTWSIPVGLVIDIR